MVCNNCKAGGVIINGDTIPGQWIQGGQTFNKSVSGTAQWYLSSPYLTAEIVGVAVTTLNGECQPKQFPYVGCEQVIGCKSTVELTINVFNGGSQPTVTLEPLIGSSLEVSDWSSLGTGCWQGKAQIPQTQIDCGSLINLTIDENWALFVDDNYLNWVVNSTPIEVQIGCNPCLDPVDPE